LALYTLHSSVEEGVGDVGVEFCDVVACCFQVVGRELGF
jgi:hypothetical protein